MTYTSRRFVLVAAPAVGLLALVGCKSTPTPGPDPLYPPVPGPYANVADDIKLVANGLNILLGYIPLSDATRTRYEGYVAQVSKAAQDIAVAVDAASAKSITQQVLAATQAALANVQGIPNLPTSATVAIAAIEVLLPIISSAAGLFSAPRPRSRLARGMSPDQARTALRNIGNRR